jgi:hypothetical protein
MCNDKLWYFGDYSEYVLSMIKYWQVMDMKVYLNLIKEGNVAIKDKTSLFRAGEDVSGKKKKKKHSQRAICYQFILPPFRAGINWKKHIPPQPDSAVISYFLVRTVMTLTWLLVTHISGWTHSCALCLHTLKTIMLCKIFFAAF